MLPPRLVRNSGKSDAGKRSAGHRAWVRSHMCCVPGCQSVPIECAHVRTGTGAGIGQKPSDKWCISLCRDHHTEQHTVGEASFERAHGIDMKQLAAAFFARSPHKGKLV